MIYEFPDLDEPIRQGDVFVGIPRVEVSLKTICVIEEYELQETLWEDISHQKEPISLVLPTRPVSAIVATQDCDAQRSIDISLCEIRKFQDIYNVSPKSIDKWNEVITTHSRFNLKWFYLPPDPRIGFEDRMGVDFQVTLHVPRVELEEMIHFRKGRLNPTADEHFRERLSEFYRRYPYDEWYPLSKEEFERYKNKHPEAKPYSWQEQGK